MNQQDIAGKRFGYVDYMRTATLLSLQSNDPVECFFQIIHQAHELVWKSAGHGLESAITALKEERHDEVSRALNRTIDCVRTTNVLITLLRRNLSPEEFKLIRGKFLEHGVSGRESPGAQQIDEKSTRLGTGLSSILLAKKLTVNQVFANKTGDLYSTACAMVRWDSAWVKWKKGHLSWLKKSWGRAPVAPQVFQFLL